MKSTLLISSFLLASFVFSQTVWNALEKANEYYRTKDYVNAEREYKTALSKEPFNQLIKYGLANTLYKQEKNNDAKKLYEEIVSKETNKDLLSTVHYNIGVVASKEKRLVESIEAYKESLRHNPNDKEARENLQKALLERGKSSSFLPKKEQSKSSILPKMSRKEIEQRLKELEQKEKQLRDRMQQKKESANAGSEKNW